MLYFDSHQSWQLKTHLLKTLANSHTNILFILIYFQNT